MPEIFLQLNMTLFQQIRQQILIMFAALLHSYAFTALASMLSSTLKSALTFRVTSKSALCLLRALVCWP